MNIFPPWPPWSTNRSHLKLFGKGRKADFFILDTDTSQPPGTPKAPLPLSMGDTPLESPSWVHGGVEETYLALPLFKAVKAQVII